MRFFLIPFQLPGLNEVLAWKRIKLERSRSGRGVPDLYALRKKDFEQNIALAARVAGFNKPLEVSSWQTVVFFDASRRDRDNVPISAKFINDCLVELRVLPKDDPSWIHGLTIHVVASDRPGVLVAFGNAPLALDQARELYERHRRK